MQTRLIPSSRYIVAVILHFRDMQTHGPTQATSECISEKETSVRFVLLSRSRCECVTDSGPNGTGHAGMRVAKSTREKQTEKREV